MNLGKNENSVNTVYTWISALSPCILPEEKMKLNESKIKYFKLNHKMVCQIILNEKH